MKIKKHIAPIATVLFLSLFAIRPYVQKEGRLLSIGPTSEMNISIFDEEEEDKKGHGTIRVKFYVKPKPPKETLGQKRKQDEVLARYQQ